MTTRKDAPLHRSGPRRPPTEPLELEGGHHVLLQVHTLRLAVLQGPDQGRVHQVDCESVLIGSAPEAHLVLADPAISGLHARISRTAGGILIEDLGSTNGTFVGGVRVREAFLSPGSRLRLGRTVLEVHGRTTDVRVDPEPSDRLDQMYGQGLRMRQVFALLRRVAGSDVTVLLRGETGTGKDMAARAIHRLSSRSAGPFVVLDASALDRDLASAELFGHETGAFTGASKSRPGAFELAHRGTLFLDEIGELPLELQPKLLRALEQREVKRLGGSRSISFDCRIVGATHRDLAEMVRKGTFREDLYYRLAHVVIMIPPLRERMEDLPLLAAMMVQDLHRSRGGAAILDDGALAPLRTHPFPGNLRELKHVLERAHIFASGDRIVAGDLTRDGAGSAAAFQPAPGSSATRGPTGADGALAQAEREVILRTLEGCDHNRTRAARALGISLPTLRKRIRDYRIDSPRGEGEGEDQRGS